VRLIPAWPPDQPLTKARLMLRTLMGVTWADVVYVQKRILNRHYFDVLRWINPRVIVDFDDAIYAPQTFARELGLATQRQGLPHLRHMLETARRVVVCNDVLADYAAAFNRNVAVLPTVVDLGVYRRARYKPIGSRIVLGWVGSASTLPYLYLLESVFAQVFKRLGDTVVLMVVCDKPYRSESGMRIRNISWSDSAEVRNIRRFDVGLMPLLDDAWSRGKCSFKAVQCMALAIPVVASPTRMRPKLIVDGHNGFVARTKEEWVENLVRLVEDSALRAELGRNAREAVARHYSVSVALPHLLSLLQGALADD